MSFSIPKHAVGDLVKIKPLENIEARVVRVYWDGTGVCYDARYFQNGEAKTVMLFTDEVEAA